MVVSEQELNLRPLEEGDGQFSCFPPHVELTDNDRRSHLGRSHLAAKAPAPGGPRCSQFTMKSVVYRRSRRERAPRSSSSELK